MRRYAPNVKRHNIFVMRGLLVLLIVLIAIAGKATWNVYHKERDSQERLSRVQEEHEELLEEEAFLTEDIDRLTTDAGIEEEIRELYGFGKEGEQVVILVENKTEADDTQQKDTNLWSRVKSWFVD